MKGVTQFPLQPSPVGEHIIAAAKRRYIDATSNHSLEKQVCTQCLSQGMLLYTQVHPTDKVDICSDCLRELSRGKTPVISLANNMWIGDIPPELSILTLPERVLIARYFPTAYIVKLYPKNGGVGFDPHNLTSGVHGNVTTYPLDVNILAHLIVGQKLPPHPQILAATIGITFVGMKGIPEKAIKVEIDETNLQALPLDDIPSQLWQVAKIDDDPTSIEEESRVRCSFNRLNKFSLWLLTEDVMLSDPTVNLDAVEEADVLLMQAHGMLDVDASNVSDSQLMAIALQNTAEVLYEAERVQVKHGSVFVNEYPHTRHTTRKRFKGTVTDPNHLLGAFPVLFPYGLGGFKVDRVQSVSYEKHTQWALQYADNRFRSDLQLIFQLFSIIVKQQIFQATTIKHRGGTWPAIFQPSDQDIQMTSVCMQVLTGMDIDLDDFVAEAGPDNATCSYKITCDPLAAAKCFHFTIQSLLQDILGIAAHECRGSNKILHQTGILSDIKAYIRTVESQGRGMLHFHLLLWLEDAPTSQEMSEVLKREEFRERVRAWLTQNIMADIGGLSTSSIEALPQKNNFSFSRPKDPYIEGYDQHKGAEIKKLARSLLVHVCKGHSCIKPSRSSSKCKQGAPFQQSKEAWITEAGQWGPKWLHPYVVGFNGTCLLLLQCNHDIKLLTNTYDTSGIVWYIMLYATKKQQKTANVSAVLAKWLAFQSAQEQHDSGVDKLHRRMINQCANALGRDQEFSVPEVISYLMGWGDRYISHNYVTIYWDAVVYSLKAHFPQLQNVSHRQAIELCDDVAVSTSLGEERERCMMATEAGLSLRDQADKRHEKQKITESPTGWAKTLPQFIGQWFPHQTKGSGYELYCASMLALFQPWRSLYDLKPTDKSFEQAFEIFTVTVFKEDLRIMDNIDYYYLSAEAANVSDVHANEGPVHKLAELVDEDITLNPDVNPSQYVQDDKDVVLSPDLIEHALDSVYTPKDHLFAHQTMQIALAIKIFEETSQERDSWSSIASITTSEQLQQCTEWEDYVKGYIRGQENGHQRRSQTPLSLPSITNTDVNGNPAISPDPAGISYIKKATHLQPQAAVTLNTEQGRAHEIIKVHMLSNLHTEWPPQLLMVVNRAGGTGKSALIDAIMSTAVSLEVPHWIQNTVMTRYLIVNEFSMVTKKMIKSLVGACNKEAFGGMNIIFFSDLHQFPLVMPKSALYHIGPSHQMGNLGWHLFERFTTIVTLTQQMRVRDQVWIDMLQHLCDACTNDDVTMLADMVEDIIASDREPLKPGQVLRTMVKGVKHTGRLATHTQLAVGMKAMVLLNIVTEADIANGTCGEITNTILDSQEPRHNWVTGEVDLVFPSTCVIIKLDHSTFPQIPGLGPKEVPISLSQTSFAFQNGDGSKTTIRWQQFAITPAYAFTDYKVQGQTIEYVIIDLAEPTQNALNPFNAYVALSRSRG
ncbi:hypothetical protein BDN71DRAFT_1428246 [Pleurotus eryngii]|uniref:ATP-dependent DNA helicase n=1 Tax=Pleurotus eryngii TaxID=5323 RepID=A0A9P6A360_PLEER|nr:hypothetical protein BDN71DRAFT_1428246 [Pleurotus eryngii]